uniref:CHK domain-containing protein n=1 Tax=Parastrongyloides trichosuri TaxID=131310 RepID=A0A0N4Z316_PARTI
MNDQEKNKIGNEILCFSCFSVYSPRPYYAIKNHSKTVPKNSDDYIDIVNIVNETGLTIPNYVYSCADVSPFQASFQLLRANVRVCKVGSESEGICVKWKGNYKDKEFVYRECWDRMWVQPRPFVNNYKEFCIGSNLQKDFNTSITNNILCFCDNKCGGKEKQIINASSYDLSEGKGCFSEVFKITFTANDGSKYSTILKVPGSSHFVHAINSATCTDDNGIKFKSSDDLVKTIVTMHNRECDFYNKIKFTNSPLADIFKAIEWIPEKNIHGCLLMRDLGINSKMQNLSEGLNLGQIFNIISIIAKLHSFSLENINTLRTFNLKCLMENMNFDEITKKSIETLKNKHGDSLGNLVDKMVAFVGNEKFIQYAVTQAHFDNGIPELLNHGDLWTNNILFQIDENNCITNEVQAVIDWQLLNIGNPTDDIARFLLLSVNGDVRRQYHDEIFEYYYKCLTTEMKDKPVPFELSNFKKCYKYSQVLQSFFLIFMITIFSNFEINENDAKVKTNKYKEDILILRLKHALEDAVDIIEKDFKNLVF